MKRHQLRWRVAMTALVLGAGTAGSPSVEAWDQSHGDSANSSFADTVTLPASLPVRKVSGIGATTPGSGPVIGPDGSVYLATSDGVLSAFSPTGDLKWKTTAPGGLLFQSSPAAGVRGDNLYVIGGRVVRDQRSGTVTTVFESQLLRYSAGGVLLSATPFPPHATNPLGASTSAAPTLWRVGTGQIVFVPVVYRGRNIYDLRLLAFTDPGGLLFDQAVTHVSLGDATGSEGLTWSCLVNPLCIDSSVAAKPGPNEISSSLQPPMPSAGLFGTEKPIVVVADQYQNLSGFGFDTRTGFREVFRKHLATGGQLSMSSPALLRDGHSVISARAGDHGWTMFAGPGSPNWAEVVMSQAIAPTLLADGRILVVSRDGSVRTLQTNPDRTVIQTVSAGAQSIVPAAASCTHIFISTASGLVTLDATSLAMVGRFDWQGGGVSPPAIAPNGAVYAVASGEMEIFAAPSSTPAGSCVPKLDPRSVQPNIPRPVRPQP